MIENILSRFDKVKKAGSGYKALCPAHNDSNPSLAIVDVGDKVLIKCWSGCTTQEIIEAVGLTWSDLFLKPLTGDEAKHRQQKQEIEDLKYSYTILEIANNTRGCGEKLSKEDLKLEKKAWRSTHDKNNR